MTSAISVKDRLKNQAATSGKTMQEVLTAYGLQEIHSLRRSIISSAYRRNFGSNKDMVKIYITNGDRL